MRRQLRFLLVVLTLGFVTLSCGKKDSGQSLTQGYFFAEGSPQNIPYPLLAIRINEEEASLYQWDHAIGGEFGLGQTLRPYDGGTLHTAWIANSGGEVSYESADSVKVTVKDAKSVSNGTYSAKRVTKEKFVELLRSTRAAHATASSSSFSDVQESACREALGMSCIEIFQ